MREPRACGLECVPHGREGARGVIRWVRFGKREAEKMNLFEKLSYVGVVLPTSITGLVSRAGSGEPFDAAGVDGLNVRMYKSWPSDNQRLLDEWSDLCDAHHAGTVFQSPSWQGQIARPFARVGRFRVCSVHRGDSLRAVLPLQVGTANQLETPGEMISDYLEPLVETDGEESAWHSMLGLMSRECQSSGCGSVVLHNVPSDGRCRQIVSRLCGQHGFTLTDEVSAQSGRVPLAKTWDDYLATLPGKERKELKRKVKNAKERAGARLSVTTTEPALSQELERVFRFMESSGGAKGRKARWTYRPMFRRIAAGLAGAGQLKVYSLYLEDKHAAGLVCFPSPNGPLLWAAGFEPEFAKWSPGIVLFALAMQDAIAGGAKYFDLLRGQMRYKSELGATDYALHRLTLRPAA